MGIIPSAAATGDSSTRCKENERAALLKLKQGLFDSSGQLSSWASDDCCRWRGVRCRNRTGHVVQLRLSNPSPSPDGDDNFLSGKISPSLLELEALELPGLEQKQIRWSKHPTLHRLADELAILDLLYNGISVDISNFGKQLSGCVRNRLQVLNLANNALGGGAPVWIGELRNLKSLHLEDNLLSSLIPPSLGTLSSLSFLYLSDNMLRGSISESFGQLSELIVWVVSYNQLSGIVSDVHFSSITRFEALLLS
ncbi:receptor-like protein 34 [Musa acuminata AAA Group]|uniref:receptor-like protein 34 n=1 Tax=Musa acuminata AAA Group TaxID=214697 RepID=UPI0031DE9D18